MFKLDIKTDNAAFDGVEASETARILREIAASLEHGDLDGPIRDANGNQVGFYELFEEQV